MPQGILELKLARPFAMPEKRLFTLLEESRLNCCKARNAAILHWYVWRKDHPDWEPGGKYTPPPLKIKRKPKKIDPAKPPKDPPFAPREFLSRELYRVATAAAPNLSANIASSCVQEVVARLRANTPYNHDGDARYVWQAILAHETQLPGWRGGRIPMPTKDTILGYDGLTNKPTNGDMARAAIGECCIRFPLLSKASGYSTLSPIVRLAAGDLSAGNKRLLRRIASGEIRLADSQITERKGKWFVQLCYEVPVSACGLSEEDVLIVSPTAPLELSWFCGPKTVYHAKARPFTLSWSDDKTWRIGNGKPMVAEYTRIQSRRRAIRYRSTEGLRKGRGKKRFYDQLSQMSRAVRDLQSRFEKQTVADIVAFALREKCGAVLYREPTMPVRKYTWFASDDVPFNWVSFEARLAFKCQTAGLQYTKARIGMKEWSPPKTDKEAS